MCFSHIFPNPCKYLLRPFCSVSAGMNIIMQTSFGCGQQKWISSLPARVWLWGIWVTHCTHTENSNTQVLFKWPGGLSWWCALWVWKRGLELCGWFTSLGMRFGVMRLIEGLFFFYLQGSGCVKVYALCLARKTILKVCKVCKWKDDGEDHKIFISTNSKSESQGLQNMRELFSSWFES